MKGKSALQDVKVYFRSGRWLPAAAIERRFVKHANSKASPGEVWQYSPDNTEINLSVIIPTYDAHRSGYFLKLLSQIGSQDFPDLELIVVRGDTRQGRAINTGAAIANGKYLLTLDDDTSLPDPGTFRKLAAVMEAHPRIGIAGGNSVIPAGASPLLKKVMKQIPRRSWEPVQTVTDSDLAEHPLLMMRTEAFKSVGGENELIPRGLDPYLRQEFRNAGYRVVVVPEVKYSHLPPATLSKLINQFYRNGKQAAFCNKFYPQWVIETPDSHGANFTEKRPLLYRTARYVVNLVKKALRGHWIYVTVYTVYAVGFVVGFLRYTDKNQI